MVEKPGEKWSEYADAKAHFEVVAVAPEMPHKTYTVEQARLDKDHIAGMAKYSTFMSAFNLTLLLLAVYGTTRAYRAVKNTAALDFSR